MIVIHNRNVRNTIRFIVPFIIIPALTIIGSAAFSRKRHIIISLAIAVLSLLLFYAGFEKRSTGTRRMVIVAVMTALCFAGRFIPFLKPISALTIISGIYLGGEAGFLVGSVTAILSNFYFGQGPWTAFQMLAWGLIGMFAGLLDIWTVLWYAEGFKLNLYFSALATAVPYTASYVISNVLFLSLLAKPFGEKLERIRIKYGI